MERSWRERDGGARCCVRGQKSTQRDKAIAPLPAVVDITSGCFLAPKLRAQAGLFPRPRATPIIGRAGGQAPFGTSPNAPKTKAAAGSSLESDRGPRGGRESARGPSYSRTSVAGSCCQVIRCFSIGILRGITLEKATEAWFTRFFLK